MRVGIDEAGKGPVIGPLCIAGVCVDAESEKQLRLLGVDDSKKLSPKKREQLDYHIKKYAIAYSVVEVDASQIDELRKIMTMNDVMVICFTKVLKNLASCSFNHVYMDAADVSEDRFTMNVRRKFLQDFPDLGPNIDFISRHRADTLCPAVSAASILAKVRRDEIISEISKAQGTDFGSGYPSDPKTKKFLEDWASNHDSFPEYVRKSWKTASSIIPFEGKLYSDTL